MGAARQRVNTESESYKLRQQLNELGEQWNPASDDSAVQQRLKNDIWAVAYKIWSPYNTKRGIGLSDWEKEAQMDAFIDTIEEVFKKFDPSRSPLTAYIEYLWKRKTVKRKQKLGVPGKNRPDGTGWEPDVMITSIEESIPIRDEMDLYAESEEQLQTEHFILAMALQVLKLIEQKIKISETNIFMSIYSLQTI